MTDASDLRERLTAALRPLGWRSADERPLLMVPPPDRLAAFVQPVGDGWAAVLEVTHLLEQRTELEHGWRRGMREAVEVEGMAVFGPAERLSVHLGLGSAGLLLEIEPHFSVDGENERIRQFCGLDDHAEVVEQIVAYARDVLLPATRRDAGFDAWRAQHESLLAADLGLPTEPDCPDWELPLMLVAQGRGSEALDLLAATGPEGATDADWQRTVAALEAFVRSGAPLPTDDAPLAALTAQRDGEWAKLTAEHEARRAELKQELRRSLQQSAVKLTVIGAASALRAWRRRGKG